MERKEGLGRSEKDRSTMGGLFKCRKWGNTLNKQSARKATKGTGR